MDQKETPFDQFDLDDILKEFAGDPLESTDDTEDVLIWDGIFSPPPPEETSVPSDTLRLDEITKALRKQVSSVTTETVAFTPVGAEPEEVYMPAEPEPPPVEPYSEDWEPEYEQPIGEYIPPEPIVFHPKSRLRELKRKLVAGPEKRYYDLTELGLGKLQLAILCSLLVALVSAGSTALYSLGMIPAERTRLVIFLQFLSLLLSALFGSYQLMEGFTDIFKKRFSLNSLLIFSLFACLADGILCLQQLRIPCCAAFSLNMTMSLWSAYQKRNTEMGQMDTMRKAIRLDSLVRVPDYYEGRPGFLRGEGQVEDFMDTYSAPAGPEKVLSVYALVVLLVGIGIGAAGTWFYGLALGIQAFSAALLVAVPATAYITLSRPMAVLERRLHKLGAVLCGWQGVRGLCGKAVFPLEDQDLFPSGSVKLNGVKFYGHRDPDEVVSCAAALMNACGGTMAPLFSQLLESRSGYHYDAENLHSYPGGIGAEVNEEAVLAGSLQFMQDMGVEMPEGTRVNQAVYVAIDGSLCGVFAITYTKTKSASNGLSTLCSYRKLTPVMTGGDFMLTESFLRSKFSANTRRMEFPPRSVRQSLPDLPSEPSPALAMTTREGLAGAAYAVTGARALRSASVAGVTVHMLGGIAGLVIMLVLALVGAEHLLNPANVLLYELIWMIPGRLITELTRTR